MSIEIRIENIKKVQKKLGEFQKYLLITNEEVANLAAETLEVAKNAAPKDTKQGVSNMYIEPLELGFAVVSPDLHMYVQEFGRTAGATNPPVEAIADWGARHGWADKDLGFLAMTIGRKGIRAKRFMQKAANYARVRLDSVLRTARVRIIKEWED